MAEPPQKRPRKTPRNSEADEAAPDVETPYENLLQLASVIRKPATPQQRPSSVGPASLGRPANRTPGTATRTPRPGGASRTNPVRRGPPTTPHAIRALQQRRNAGLTPGQTRRRSGRVQRETPREALRNLSKILARTTKPVEPSPLHTEVRATQRSAIQDFDDDEPDLPPPRLSIPLNDIEDEDSFHEAPPRLSLAFDDNDTVQSVEAGRRALAEQARARLSGSSLRGARLSERLPGVDESGIDGLPEVDDAGGFVGTEADDTQAAFGDATGELVIDENTQEFRALMDAAARRQSRRSELDVADSPQTEGDPTFVFRIPDRPRDASPIPGGDVEQEDEDAEEDEQIADDDRADEDGQDVDGVQAEDDAVSEQEADAEAEAAEHDERIYRKDSITRGHATERTNLKPAAKRQRRELKVSKFGIEYPSLPPAVIKRLATTFAGMNGNSKAKLSKDTLAAIVQASDWFFEQAAEDLASYAEHAGRKIIDESDVITLMKRQRQITANTTPFSLAQKYLPRELLQDIRMAPPVKINRHKRARMDTIDEEGEE